MISQTTAKFWKAFNKLPKDVKEAAIKCYKKWKSNPYNSDLNFKQIHPVKPIYSVRIKYSWRAVGIKQGTTMVWYWIGSHADYDNLIAQL